MKQVDYWNNRFLQLEAAQNQKGVEYYATLEREFEKAAQQTDKELAAWYSRYANHEGITFDEAKRLLNTKELSKFRMSVDDYIKKGKTLNYSDQWAKELERASAKFHVTRLEALKLQMQQQIENMYGYELDTFDQFIADQYKSGYYKTMFEIQKGFNVGFDMMTLDDNKIAKLIATPWAPDGQNFSSRIWRDKNKLMNDLPTILIQASVRGEGYVKTAKTIMDRFNVSKSQAKNLVVTESAFFSSESQKDCFNDLGVEKYEIVATLDSRTSEICQMMDGKVFDMKDRRSGITSPPFHCRCRTTTAPYFDDDFDIKSSRAARGSDGKTYQIDTGIKYPEWEKSFVKGGSKSGYTSMDLQLFAKNDKKDIKRKIRNGELDGDLFYSQKKKFDKIFENGIETPLGKVYNKGDNFYHIANGHDEMVDSKAIERVKQTLIAPIKILETKDVRGNTAITYTENKDENPMIVVTRGDIVTAYIPKTKYLNKLLKKGCVLYDKKN